MHRRSKICFVLTLLVMTLHFIQTWFAFHSSLVLFENISAICLFLCFGYDYYLVMSKDADKKVYLEYAGKIIRHDMHSGINTYIPRGIHSLKRKLPEEVILKYKLGNSIQLIEDGLIHTQTVYQGVKAFTNLVRKDAILETELCDLKEILHDYLSRTAYAQNVSIDTLPLVKVNPALFCTAIDNLIRNGLKYNDNKKKMVVIMMEGNDLLVIDNGRGIGQHDFERLSQPYVRGNNQIEAGSGLGLNITRAILDEHGFSIQYKKLEVGTEVAVRVL